ncbi:TonB-dependent receptor [Pedobacter sp. GR22-6]|uniref:TonB-dependent receptor n=1 Tax=Pedobacter sp. GR22-6 TaxID=3127957 RepID=UPI00307E4067
MKSSLFLFCLLSITGLAFGQQIKISGKVRDASGQVIPSASVQLKTTDGQVLSFTSGNEEGSYQLEGEFGDQQSLYLIAAYIGLKRDTLKLNVTSISTGVLQHDFKLQDDAIQLETIHIRSEQPIVSSANDTTKYNVARLTTADDRNIESVIKKMPGMKVSNDGTIYFNQQRITKVLLEGDDMTGEGYKTITQNLKPQLVEEVQAIENYVEDDLLNGVISSEEVVLNLKIKDKKSISGSIDAGYGSNDRNDLSGNFISFYKGIKAFSFLNNNNIGKYQADLLNLSNKSAAPQSGKLINHAIEDTNPFDNNYFRLNKSLSGSLSAIDRVSKNLKLTLGLYGIRNKLYDERNLLQRYYLQDTIVTEDLQNRRSNSKNYQLEFSADQKLDAKSRLFASFTYTTRPDVYHSNDLSMFNGLQANEVLQQQSGDDRNIRSELRYVLKSSANTALIASARYNSAAVRQNYTSQSDLYGSLPDFFGAQALMQLADTRLNQFGLDVQALRKSTNHYFYLNAGAFSSISKLETRLYSLSGGVQNLPGDEYANQNRVNNSEMYLGAKYIFDNKRIRLQLALRGNLRNIELYGRDSSYFYLQPSLNLKARLGEGQELILGYQMQNTSPDNLSYYQNYVLTDLRNLSSGLSQLYYYNTQDVNIAYQNNTFSAHYLSFRISGNANYSPFGFINTNFFDNALYYTQRSLYKSIRSIGGNTVFQKFIPALSIDATVDFSLSKRRYYASIGQEINPYSNLTQNLLLKLGTGFKLPVNFTLQFSYLNESVQQQNAAVGRNEAYKYSIASRIKLGKSLSHVTVYDLYRINRNDYHILNTEFLYNPGNGKISYGISGKNLFNVNSLINSSVSNVGESRGTASLLGRYILLNVSVPIGGAN